ncbi:Hypothetical predicted protein [Pelobates cultripes]|uniref:Uncharacterized protein n=1 Tax=Pelobates cultripes TaxID=61616 RepID=A0AAD1SG63_PELCU|nr:Hypothetical predicted protein [Pelobates cultripes]
MDGFLQPPRGNGGGNESPPPAAQHSAQAPGEDPMAIERIGEELRNIAVAMATKADLLTLTTTIQEALRAEMAGLRTEVTAQAGRIQALEQTAETHSTRINATDVAIARQGDMILHMRRNLEDLDNRGRRCNIRIRGIPEADEGENAAEVLTNLFRTILHTDAPQTFEFERAHRTLRPRSAEDGPRDMICCLHSFPIKDTIMRKARERPTWPFQGTQVSLYNDLSPYTLEARRALKPITTALRERNIKYKWGFPFALMARHQDSWLAARWPDEIPRLLDTLNMPHIQFTDWLLDTSRPVQRQQRAARRRGERSPPGPPPRRRMGRGEQAE